MTKLVAAFQKSVRSISGIISEIDNGILLQQFSDFVIPAFFIMYQDESLIRALHSCIILYKPKKSMK